MKIGMRKLRFFILFCIVCSPGLMIPQLIVNDELSIQDVPLTTETVMKTASISMPFIKNVGQADPQVKFYANTFAGTAYLTENDLTYVIPTEDGSFVIKETPHGGDLAPSADTPSETVVSYFKGTEENWHTDIPTYDSVSAGFVWDGVSLSLKAYGNNIEKLFTVFPGTNPDVIKMNFDGVESLSVDKSGKLLIHTTVGDITMTAPVAYQHIDGIKKFVPVKYSTSNTIYGFILGDYEKTLPVVIDPLLASTFLGGSDEDTSNAIAIDSSGNVYVTGSTIDHTTDLPVTSGAYDEALNGGQDIYVSKFSSDLTSLSASTYFGGGGTDDGLDIAIDSSDNVYVTGWTQVHATLQPTTDGAYDESHNGSYDVFVSKFSSDLTSLSASTFLGGSGIDFGFAIAIDSSDNVYVTGYTGVASTNFPVTDGAYDEDRVNQGAEVFVSKFSSDLTSLSASTFLGGSSDDWGLDIAIDSSDNVYVTGYTGIKPGWPDDTTDLPVTSGAYDESHNGNVDAFVSKFSSDLTSLSASTFLGGSGWDYGLAIAIDSSDSVYVTGYQIDHTTDLPTTGGAYDESHNGGNDAFVSKFSSDLTSLSASTFLGGSGDDAGSAIAFDSSGNVYVTGSTADDTTDLPVTSGAYDESHNGGNDAFVSKFSSDLTSLSESTFLGGSGNDAANDIAIDSSDNVYVTGNTADDTTDLPVTSGAYDEVHNSDDDVFVSKFSFDNTGPTVTITSSSGDCGDSTSSTTLSYTATFSESTSNFVVGDITVTGTANGGSPEASNFAGSGTTYTFDVVQGSSDGTVIVSIAAGVATDAAVNLNTASDSCTFTIETVSPTVTITSSSGDCGDTVNSTTLSYTVTFSESTSNFVVGDITVTGTANNDSPEASNFAGSGTTYTFDVIKGSSDGTVIVSVAAGVATDAAGNDNTASDSCTFTIETVSPTVTITPSSGDCGDTVNSITLSYTVTFSESTSNFVVGDITVTGTANGGSPEASNFAGSGTTYTFDVVKGTSDGTVIVSVAAGVATDAAGNDNTASDSCTFTIDTVGPTVTITSSTGDSGGTISSGTVRYTITFNSSVTGFTIGDITVTGTANGGSPAASNFAGSGTTYTFDVVRGSSGGTVTVKIAADVATDSDGNDNTISNTYELTVESLAFSSNCSKHTLLGNCGTISINNDVYRIAKNWNNFPATEVLVGDPVTITLSIPKKPTYTKISSASVYTEIFDSPKNYEQSSYIDYSPMNNKITYISQSQLFQVAGATHRIIQDPDVMNLDRFEVVFTMIFAKPMDTSHIVIETKNSSGFPEIIYLTNALKVSERPVYALTLEEQSKFELTYKPEIEPESDMKREIESEPDMKQEIEPEPKGICGKGTVLKDNMCVPKEWSFFDFFEQLMKLFG